jgi:hypothetical protein
VHPFITTFSVQKLKFEFSAEKLKKHGRYTLGSQTDIYDNIRFQNLTIWINTYIYDLSFSKNLLLKVLQSLKKQHAKV